MNSEAKTATISEFGNSSNDGTNKSSISSFHSKYDLKVPEQKKPQNKTSETSNADDSSSEEDNAIYRINFDDDGECNNNDLATAKINGPRRLNLYDTLSVVSRAKLEEYAESRDSKLLQNLRVCRGRQILEFVDCMNTCNYNSFISLQELSSCSSKFENSNIFFFNNLTEVTSLTLDVETLNFIFKPIYTPRQNEMISFVSTGTKNYEGVVMIGEMASRRILFFDAQKNEKLFDISIDSEEPMTNAVVSGKSLYVSFIDNTVQKICVRMFSKKNLLQD